MLINYFTLTTTTACTNKTTSKDDLYTCVKIPNNDIDWSSTRWENIQETILLSEYSVHKCISQKNDIKVHVSRKRQNYNRTTTSLTSLEISWNVNYNKVTSCQSYIICKKKSNIYLMNLLINYKSFVALLLIVYEKNLPTYIYQTYQPTITKISTIQGGRHID